MRSAEEALEFIRFNYGRVCEEFETCQHIACSSSYGAWAEADLYLRSELRSKEEIEPMTTFQEALKKAQEKVDELSLRPDCLKLNEAMKKVSTLLQAQAIIQGVDEEEEEVEKTPDPYKWIRPKAPKPKKIQQGSIAQRIFEALEVCGPTSREGLQVALKVSPKNFWRVIKEFEGSHFIQEENGDWAAIGFTSKDLSEARLQPLGGEEIIDLEAQAPKAPPVEDEDLIRVG